MYTDVYDLLKENLMTRDDAVIGEAAGLAMGLVMIGTRSAIAIEDMFNVRINLRDCFSHWSSSTILSS